MHTLFALLREYANNVKALRLLYRLDQGIFSKITEGVYKLVLQNFQCCVCYVIRFMHCLQYGKHHALFAIRENIMHCLQYGEAPCVVCNTGKCRVFFAIRGNVMRCLQYWETSRVL